MTSVNKRASKSGLQPTQTSSPPTGRRRGPKPKPIAESPRALFNEWTEPATFSESLALHLRRHGDTGWTLWRAIVREGERFDRATLRSWIEGRKAPRSVASMAMLARIEARYRLPTGHFKALLPHPARAVKGHAIAGAATSELRRLAWHLPDDFCSRSPVERAAIVDWVRSNIVAGSTDYRRYQAAAIKHPYAIRFPALTGRKRQRPAIAEEGSEGHHLDPELAGVAKDAPAALAAEMASLVAFKTATLTDLGYQRSGVWGEETASQRIEHLGLLFGSLTASPAGPVAGFGVPLEALGLGLLVFPAVWDWYLLWRERRRGFYTQWEVDILQLAAALCRAEVGWLRQSPTLADRLRPIASMVSEGDIQQVRSDWSSACERLHRHALARSREIKRVARVHRDPFEPILPVLEAESPLAEYRRITEEILARMPDARRYPRSAAEAIRSFLMLRLGLHLGVRQKNLRQLIVCPRGGTPRSERQLETLGRGELRWSDRASGWEVLIPAVAFKNANSSFFAGKPFRLSLPDLGGLYRHIDAYVRTHRSVLLAGAQDPGTFFVKTAKRTTTDAAYDRTTFYEAWRLIIQRYGIWNPFTERGAIRGLLPHGPHNVRDVIATHILKQTGSYEQASYAIQDTPDVVAQHYGRFLPQDKAALAAEILNRVWATP